MSLTKGIWAEDYNRVVLLGTQILAYENGHSKITEIKTRISITL